MGRWRRLLLFSNSTLLWNDPPLSLILGECLYSASILHLHLDMKEAGLLLKALPCTVGVVVECR